MLCALALTSPVVCACQRTALKVSAFGVFVLPEDQEYMRRALALAAQARGRTSPNPMVGCVIVRGGQVLGEGWHVRAGGPHAEVVACQQAGAELAGTTVYVTLEPCAHHGKTPPCVDLLLRARPARVVVAMEDPNPLVSGRGIAALREAGIAVELGLLEVEARRLNEVFDKFIRTNLPFVIAKCAMTLDGKIATRTGNSQWVTGEAARRRVHELRNEVDAILVGSRTAIMDNPSLTTRLEAESRDPIRIVLDAADYLVPDLKMFHQASTAPTWVATTEAREYPGAQEVLRFPPGPGGVDMRALIRELGRRQVTSLLIEGGGTTLASAFEAGVVDKVLFFVAPKIVGGRDAITPVEGEGAERMEAAVQLDALTAEQVGEDVLLTAYVKR